MKKTMCRAAAVILMAAMMLTLLAGCEKNDVKDTISKFENACQALDVREMLACINPNVSKPILGAMNLFGVEDTSGLLDELVGVLGIFEGAGEATEEFVRSIQITPQTYEFNDAKDKCTVAAKLSCGEDNTKDITIELVCMDDVWYISNIGF